MGISERKIRSQEKLRHDILSTAMHMVKAEGADAISLRKIADEIEYSAPIIYSYFKNKRAILNALCNVGYEQLLCNIEENRPATSSQPEELIALLNTLWNFATRENELYMLMYDSGVCAANAVEEFPALRKFMEHLRQSVGELLGEYSLSEEDLLCRTYAAAGLIHGIISTSFFWKTDAKTSIALRNYGINAFINSLTGGLDHSE
ncbi:TetR/AcrR family transcriptional regulator [Mucilaginibacter agri]|uniref:TetR family transcriptional regulator n=1 Tax=Mucilaginibacter agri TaxID=2695265 RepID=A0A966DW55_9SPHI|nr:TetR/AcrR family transcriptional regulator [Mucilaginibacter agri]NCD71124.1 TetR family transcriptional regulator [Mucilaginibacter agri]